MTSHEEAVEFVVATDDVPDVPDVPDVVDSVYATGARPAVKRRAPDKSVSVAASDTLYSFLLGCKVDKGSDHTHTSFQRPTGAFYVPSSQTDRFLALYKKALEDGEDLYLTEKHRHIGPVIIDLDFRFQLRTEGRSYDGAPPGEAHRPERRYSRQHLEGVAYVYGRAIKALLDPASAPAYIDFYVQEKLAASYASPTLVKDGVHMVVPGVVLRTSAQYVLRRDVLPQLQEVLSDLELHNKIEDVVDEAVVERNNWMLYGSKKPRGESYRVTQVLRFDVQHEDLVRLDGGTATGGRREGDLVELLSIRNKFDESALMPARMAEVEAEQARMDDRQKRRDMQQQVVGTVVNTRMVTCESLETVERMVGILTPARAESYATWIRVGWCLRNIDHRLLPKWVEFSRLSPKYHEGECEKLWNYMRPGGLGVGTLYMWAKADNPEQYREIVRKDLVDLILRSSSGTHHDVARVIYHMYRYEYVCASIRNKCWFEFRDHRWRQSDCAYTLRKKISTDVGREYLEVAMHYNKMSMVPGTNEGDAERFSDVAQKLHSVSLKLKTTNFKENVMKECCELFYQEKFEEKLDSACHLIGFENGVYDLDNLEFRAGRAEDYISYSTGINYVEYDPEHAHVKDVTQFLERVLPNRAVREYVLRVLSGALNGHIREERFHVWTGSGSNGKSRTIELFEKSFGDYCCKFPVTLLTQKRAASNAATSEIARAKGKRFAVLQEPCEDEKLNIGLMKELTGGDKIMTRKLYSEPQEWKPQWTLALLCNHLPNVPSDDGGTWRRIRVVEFNSRFVPDPNPEKPNEFPMDQDISKRFDVWREHFMSMLIDIYRENVNKRTAEPEEVTACTREYQKNNDHMADFVDTCLQRDTNGGSVTIADVFQVLKDWIREDNIPIRVPKKKDVQNYMDKNVVKGSHAGAGRIVYKGYTLRDRSGAGSMGGGGLGDDPMDDILFSDA